MWAEVAPGKQMVFFKSLNSLFIIIFLFPDFTLKIRANLWTVGLQIPSRKIFSVKSLSDFIMQA